MLSEHLQGLINDIKAGKIDIKCSITGRKAIAIDLRSRDIQNAYWCAQCCIDKLHTNDYRADTVVTIEDFIQGLQSQLENWTNRHMDEATLDRTISKFSQNLEKAYTSKLVKAFQHNLDYISTVLGEPFEGNSSTRIIIAQKDADEQSTEVELALFSLVNAYRQIRSRKDIATSIKLPLVMPDNSRHRVSETTQIKNMMTGDVYRKLAHLNSVAGGVSPIDKEIETINRFKCYTEKVEFETHRQMSICVKASKQTIMYGFAFYQSQASCAGLCNISIGKCNNHDSIVDVFEFELDPSPSIKSDIPESEVGLVSPVLLPNPIIMVPGLYYNVAIKLNESLGSHSQTMMRGQGVSSLSLEARYELKSGNTITMMLGKDDDSDFSIYNGIIPVFYFRTFYN